jgi:4-hydroxy-3-methylbut-2-enyl diphosphate reductase
MEIVVAPRFAGFCNGVKRAWKLAFEEAGQQNGPIYLSGKLIHNDPAMDELDGMGIKVLDSDDAPPDQSTLIVRAHGEGPKMYERATQLGMRTVDATCSIVKAVQRRARALEQRGYQVILFGHKNHPEAQGTIGYTDHGIIVETVEEARQLGFHERIAGIAQTTAAQWEYEEVTEVLKTKCDELEDQGRICGWTVRAQREAEEIASSVDAMVVVGGKDSSNTQRLVEVCSRHCPSYHIETLDALAPEWFVGLGRVGVTAGASTRDQDIEATVEWLMNLELARVS